MAEGSAEENNLRGLYAGLMIVLLGPPIGGLILWFCVSAALFILGRNLKGWAGIRM